MTNHKYEDGAQVNDVSVATNQLSISGETVTFADGATGTAGTTSIDKAPIYDATGTNVAIKNAHVSDTSFVLTTSGVISTEVRWDYDQSDDVQTAAMSNGEYAIDYITGKIRYKKASAGTSDTVDYTTRQVNVETTGSTSTVTPNINVNQIGGVSTNVNGGNRNTGTLTVTLADNDPGVTSLGVLDDWDESDRAKVNLVPSQSGVAANSGNMTDNTLRIVIADDDNVSTDLTAIKTAVEIVDDWDATEDSAVGSDGIQMFAEARTGQKDAVTGGNAVRIVSNRNGEIVLASHTWATDSIRTEEIDPVPEKYIAETLADVTNGTDGTYSYYIDMNSYRKGGFQLELSGGATGSLTVTVEGSIQDDGTAPASVTYQDITLDTFGSGSYSDSVMLIDNAEKLACYKYVKLKVIANTGGMNDADWTIYHKRLY